VRRDPDDQAARSGGPADDRPAIELIVDGGPIKGTRIPLPEPGTARVRVEAHVA